MNDTRPTAAGTIPPNKSTDGGAAPAPARPPAPPADFATLTSPPDGLAQTLPQLPAPAASGLAPELARLLAPPQAADELGRLGNYRILAVLGQGGMGAVFAAEDPTLGRRVAVKVMKPEVAAHPGARDRFLREARAAAALQHDHIVTIHHVGEQGGVPFIVMPLMAGESLEDRLRRESPLPVAEGLRIGREVAEGLAAAHAAGLVHRDIKPANLWLEARPGEPGMGGGPQSSAPAPGGRVKILDFGLARDATATGERAMTQAGTLLGTPGYMSPEQVDGLPVDCRSDLFSLGCVLYRLATGTAPFSGGSLSSMLWAVVEQCPPPPCTVRPELPATLSDLILRLLAKTADGRPASAHEVVEALRAIDSAAGGPSPGSASPAAKSPRRPRRTWTIKLTIALTLSFGLLLAVVLPLWHQDSAAPHGQVEGALATPGPRYGPVEGVLPAPGPALMTLDGTIDIRVWRTGPDGAAARLRLTDAGALPLKPGDQFRIEATADRPAYLYLFWIDTEGKAVPVYPWQPGKWGTRPGAEQPVAALERPAAAAKGYTISGDRPGMETVILVARAERLDLPDEQIQGWFAGLPAQRPFQNPESAVWFENGRIVTGDDSRRQRGFEETDIADPVLRVQGLLKDRIGPHAAFTAAVSFARLGRGGTP